MKSMSLTRPAALLALLLFTASAAELTVIKSYPLDALDEITVQGKMRIDTVNTADGKGSIRIRGRRPGRILLFETGDINAENALLIYQAKLKVAGFKGDVFLEMLCVFPGGLKMQSQGLDYSLSGTTDWVDVETKVGLRKGENPDNVKLDLVINGKGTVWIDDVRLVTAPPPDLAR